VAANPPGRADAVDQMASKLAIREVVECWAVWRDAGDWDRFASVWHADGYMTATWFQGSFRDFIAVSRQGFEAGVQILHFLGGNAIDVRGDRAISQTKMTINQRASVHGVEVDVVCTAGSLTSSSAATDAGPLCGGSRSTSGIAWTLSTPRPGYPWTRTSSTASPSDTGTSPTCRVSWGSPSRRGCRGWMTKRAAGSARKAAPG
jgi:hypothetical protein